MAAWRPASGSPICSESVAEAASEAFLAISRRIGGSLWGERRNLTDFAEVLRKECGVDAGMHTLVRPALYGAWHPVVNLTRLGAPPAGPVTIVGPICESGDVLARDRLLPETHEGDVLLIGFAGAYGAAMQSTYNGEAEYLIRGGIVENWDGSVTLFPIRSQANLMTFRTGITIGL